jgi:NAD(P)-dependent dehydrogenase (short-subunit alcohol dehydrogenase family)
VLTNKCIVVIGGTTGLGLSAAKAFVRAGASAVVVGRSAESVTAAQKELGDFGRALEGDATVSSTAEFVISVAVETFGRFDGLYHVAGGSGRSAGDGPLHELTDEGIAHTIDQNLVSLIYSNRAAVRQLLKQGSGGAILNMSSVLGFSPSPAFFATHVYAAAKSAVIGLTRSAASYYAKDDIRFNAIAPALVDTPMARRAVGDSNIQQYVRSKQPLDGGRVGRAEDVDAAATFLLSDEAKFITGQVLCVDGGWSVTEGQIPNDSASCPT